MKTVKTFSEQKLNCKVLLVVSSQCLKQFARNMHGRCPIEISVHHTADDTIDLSTQSAKLVLAPRESCVQLLTLSKSRIADFDLAIFDLDTAGDHPDPSTTALTALWLALPHDQRPCCVDLPSLGSRHPLGDTRADPTMAPGTECYSLAEPDVYGQLPPSPDPPTLCPDNNAPSASARIPDWYPFETAAAQLTVLNSGYIFLQYCQALLGAAVPAALLFRYSRWKKHRSNVLCTIHYPGPGGYTKVTKRKAQKLLRGRNLEGLCANDDISCISRSDLQERWFLYIVVLHITSQGFMDEKFRPTAQVMEDSKAIEWGEPVENKPSLMKSFVPVCLSSILPDAGSASTSSALPWNTSQAPMQALTQLLSRLPLMSLNLETTSITLPPSAPAFVTTIDLDNGHDCFTLRGRPSAFRREAEQLAAVEAVDFIMSGRFGKVADLPSLLSPVPCLRNTPPPPAMQEGILGPAPRAPPAPAPKEVPSERAMLHDLLSRVAHAGGSSLSVQYSTEPFRNAWISTVHIHGASGDYYSFTGDAHPTRQQSEDSATHKAVAEISRHLRIASL